MKKTLLAGLALMCVVASNSMVAKNKNTINKNTFVAPATMKEGDYTANTIIFKVNESLADLCFENKINDAEIKMSLDILGVQSLKKLSPFTEKPKIAFNAQGQKFADLTRTYQLNYSSQ